MSQLHAELTSQAADLGLESIEQAEANGYKVDYTGSGWVLRPDVNKAMEEAHQEWLKEKEEAIRKLELTLENVDLDDVEHVQNAIDFIKGLKYDS